MAYEFPGLFFHGMLLPRGSLGWSWWSCYSSRCAWHPHWGSERMQAFKDFLGKGWINTYIYIYTYIYNIYIYICIFVYILWGFHGRSPIAGWFISWKIHLYKWRFFSGCHGSGFWSSRRSFPVQEEVSWLALIPQRSWYMVKAVQSVCSLWHVWYSDRPSLWMIDTIETSLFFSVKLTPVGLCQQPVVVYQ